MDTQPVQVQININSDTSGVQQASAAVDSFSNSLQNVVSIAAGVGLTQGVDQIVSMGQGALDQVAQFQTATTAMGVVLGNLGDVSNQSADTVAASGGKIKNTAQEITDATITYNEKIKQLQDDIATVMQGQNVIDAQNNLNTQLEDLATQHTDKILSLQQQITDAQTSETDRATARAQSATNTLQDMQDAQNNKMADLAEKHAQQMADATGTIQKANLQKKYDEEVQYDTDAFNRAYATKQEQLQRNQDQQNAADKKATNDKIADLNDQIAKENKAYDDKIADDNKKADAQIEKFKADNAKKLATYKEELADEERLYKEHIAKIESAGGGAANALAKALSHDDPWSAYSDKAINSLSGMATFLNNFATNSPFNFTDITKYTAMVEQMGYNAEKLDPVIQNIAAGTGHAFGTTTQAMLDGLNGRLTMMMMTLGISKKELQDAGAEFTTQGQLVSQSSLLKAFDYLSNHQFKGGSDAALHTFSGALSNVQDNLFKFNAGVMGMNTATDTVDKNGALYRITDAMIKLGQWTANNKDLIKTVQDLIVYIGVVSGLLITAMLPALVMTATTGVTKLTLATLGFIQQGWIWMGQMATQILEINGISLSAGIAAVATGLWETATWGLNLALAVLMSPITLVVLGVVALVAIVYELITHWKQVELVGTQAWNSLMNTIKHGINDVLPFINKLIDGINAITFGKLNIQHVSALAYSGNDLTAANLSNDFSNFTLNPLEQFVANLTANKGSSGANASSQTTGSQLSALQNSATSNKQVSITNYNTFNTPGSPQQLLSNINYALSTVR